MKAAKILALLLALCLLFSVGVLASGEASGSGEASSFDLSSLDLSEMFPGGMPDTSLGGSSTRIMTPPSSKPFNELGARAALYVELVDGAYTVTQNVTDAYTVKGLDNVPTPVVGELYTLDGIYLECSRIDWDEEGAVGNTGIVFSQYDDDTTPVHIGGAEYLYEGPDGEMYNTFNLMNTA